jgi:hypothetical protein
MRVRRATRLGVRAVVLVTRSARARDLRVGVARRAALDVAGAGFEWGVRDGEGDSEGREEEEGGGEEVHGCGWSEGGLGVNERVAGWSWLEKRYMMGVQLVLYMRLCLILDVHSGRRRNISHTPADHAPNKLPCSPV